MSSKLSSPSKQKQQQKGKQKEIIININDTHFEINSHRRSDHRSEVNSPTEIGGGGGGNARSDPSDLSDANRSLDFNQWQQQQDERLLRIAKFQSQLAVLTQATTEYECAAKNLIKADSELSSVQALFRVVQERLETARKNFTLAKQETEKSFDGIIQANRALQNELLFLDTAQYLGDPVTQTRSSSPQIKPQTDDESDDDDDDDDGDEGDGEGDEQSDLCQSLPDDEEVIMIDEPDREVKSFTSTSSKYKDIDITPDRAENLLASPSPPKTLLKYQESEGENPESSSKLYYQEISPQLEVFGSLSPSRRSRETLTSSSSPENYHRQRTSLLSHFEEPSPSPTGFNPLLTNNQTDNNIFTASYSRYQSSSPTTNRQPAVTATTSSQRFTPYPPHFTKRPTYQQTDTNCGVVEGPNGEIWTAERRCQLNDEFIYHVLMRGNTPPDYTQLSTELFTDRIPSAMAERLVTRWIKGESFPSSFVAVKAMQRWIRQEESRIEKVMEEDDG